MLSKNTNFGAYSATVMNRYIKIVFLLALAISSCKKKEGDIIADIKKKSAEINAKLKDYKVKHAEDLTTTAKGSITGYYRDDEVKKMYLERYSDNERAFTEYYFDDGMLILIIKQEYVYNKPFSYTEEKAKQGNDSEWYDDKKTRLVTEQCYFSENKLIKWISDNKDISVSPKNFADEESQLWAETLILLKQLKEQD